MNDPIRKVGMLTHDVMKATIGRDDRVSLLDREREVETIVAGMVQVEREPS